MNTKYHFLFQITCIVLFIHVIKLNMPYKMKIYRDCPVPSCNFRTCNGSTMSMHISMKHRRQKSHECPICHEMFSVKTQLQHHFVNNHCEPDIVCKHPQCNKKFKTDASHKIHYARVHMKHILQFEADFNEGYVKCQYCEHVCKPGGMYYHSANCSPYSPFSSNYKEPEKTDIKEHNDESNSPCLLQNEYIQEPYQAKESWEYDIDASEKIEDELRNIMSNKLNLGEINFDEYTQDIYEYLIETDLVAGNCCQSCI